jgi:hypothetical protein
MGEQRIEHGSSDYPAVLVDRLGDALTCPRELIHLLVPKHRVCQL